MTKIQLREKSRGPALALVLTCVLAAGLAAVDLATADLATAGVLPVQPGESIGDALWAASAGDTVLLGAGIYQEQGLYLKDGVVLRSATGLPALVKIATDGSQSILAVAPLAGSSTRVEGITFTSTAQSPDERDLVRRGGAVLCQDAWPVFADCRFEYLRAVHGGAVFCGEGAGPTFISCVFRHNRAAAVGGALTAFRYSNPTLQDCLVVDNAAGHLGGAFNLARNVELTLQNCTVAANGSEGPALSCWADAFVTATGCIISDAGVWSGDYSGLIAAHCSDIHSTDGPVALAPQASGNLALDPLFCGNMAGDHKYDLAEASPCTPEASPGCGGMGSRPVGCGLSSIDDPPSSQPTIPLQTRLRETYPNPFNPSTTIKYGLADEGPVSLTVYNLAGRLVRVLVQESLAAGQHQAVWRGRDAQGRVVAAGVYFVRLKAAGVVDTRRITLVK